MYSDRRTVIVTGGSMGIGKEIAAAFANNGDYVIICARNQAQLTETAAEIQTFEGQVITAVCDVSNPEAVKGFIDSVGERFERIDVLVNNAGIYGPIGLTFENDTSEWLRTMEINLFGTFLMSKAVLPMMVEAKGGSIINMSGGGATGPKPRYSAYATTKAAVVRLTEVLAVELQEYNIRVNAIAPGFIVTRFHEETIAAGEAAGKDFDAVKNKLESGGDDPKHAAELALFLASEKAQGLTGRLISAIWDEWREFDKQSDAVDNANLYTLRRIDDVFFKEVPKE